MKVYVSGPMSGIEDHNYPAFNNAAVWLRGQGYRVANPAELDLGRKNWTWEECLRDDIKVLMECDAVYFLPGWEKSKGAKLEGGIALALGFTFLNLYREEFIKAIREG